MSTVSFSGLATGLDTASLIEQLLEIKKQPMYRLERNKQSYQAQITALGAMKAKLEALQDAAKALDTANEFSSLSASTTWEDYLSVDASTDAAPGSYDIIINSLAVAQKDISQGYDSTLDSVGEGTVSFTIDGEVTELTLSGVTTLEDLKDQINNNVTGVSASIINTGADTGAYTLVIGGSEAGSDNAFTLDFSGVSGGITPTFTNQTAAADASLTVDGIAVTAASNTPSDVISGLTLNLMDADPTRSIHVEVEVDSEGIAEKVKALVDAHNDLFSFIQDQNKTTGDLRGNPALRSVSNRIENIFSSSFQDGLGDVTMFAMVGITRGSNRQLEWSEDDFTTALTENFSGVRDLFIEREGNLGKMYMIDQAVEDMTDSIDGYFKISTDSLNRKIDYADQSIERYKRSVESYRLTMRRKFAAMELMVSQLQAQGNYLSSIFY